MKRTTFDLGAYLRVNRFCCGSTKPAVLTRAGANVLIASFPLNGSEISTL